MKIVDLKCPHCGAALHVDGTNMKVTCKYCGQTIYVDDEVQHIQYDNAEQAGYEFEKGRQRAQAEQKARRQQQRQQQQSAMQYNQAAAANNKKSSGCVGTCWKIFLWLCFFPIMLTIWIYKTDKIQDKRVKGGLIAALWILVIIYYIAHPSSSSKEQTSTTATTEVAAEVNTEEDSPSVDEGATEDTVTDVSTEEASSEDTVSEEMSTSESTEVVQEEAPQLIHTTTGKDELANEYINRFNEISSKQITEDMIELYWAKDYAMIWLDDASIQIDYPRADSDDVWFRVRYNGEPEVVRQYFIDFTKAMVPDAEDEVLGEAFDEMVNELSVRNSSDSRSIYGYECYVSNGVNHKEFFLLQYTR